MSQRYKFKIFSVTFNVSQFVGRDMVVLDLIPAIFFLPYYPLKNLMDFTKKVIDMFAPRLILGVSDELPPNGQIEKIEAISQFIENEYK